MKRKFPDRGHDDSKKSSRKNRYHPSSKKAEFTLAPYAQSGRYPSDELKFFGTVRAAHIPAAAGTISNASLNLIVQGATDQNRIGRKCVVSKIVMRCFATLPVATGTAAATMPLSSDFLRFILYLDKQANGATAAVTDILETATIQSMNNLTNVQRFYILKDKLFELKARSAICQGASDAVTTGEDCKYFSVFKKCNIPLEFSGAAGAITELRSTNIGVLCLTTSGLISLAYTARVRFSE